MFLKIKNSPPRMKITQKYTCCCNKTIYFFNKHLNIKNQIQYFFRQWPWGELQDVCVELNCLSVVYVHTGLRNSKTKHFAIEKQFFLRIKNPFCCCWAIEPHEIMNFHFAGICLLIICVLFPFQDGERCRILKQEGREGDAEGVSERKVQAAKGTVHFLHVS